MISLSDIGWMVSCYRNVVDGKPAYIEYALPSTSLRLIIRDDVYEIFERFIVASDDCTQETKIKYFKGCVISNAELDVITQCIVRHVDSCRRL